LKSLGISLKIFKRFLRNPQISRNCPKINTFGTIWWIMLNYPLLPLLYLRKLYFTNLIVAEKYLIIIIRNKK